MSVLCPVRQHSCMSLRPRTSLSGVVLSLGYNEGPTALLQPRVLPSVLCARGCVRACGSRGEVGAPNGWTMASTPASGESFLVPGVAEHLIKWLHAIPRLLLREKQSEALNFRFVPALPFSPTDTSAGGYWESIIGTGGVRQREDVRRGRGCAVVQYSTRDDLSLLVCALVDVGSIYMRGRGG